MAISLKPLDQQVIVITGASSGIGLKTAESAVERGARVVLAARSGETLDDIVQRLNSKGERAISVVADVADRKQVQAIADAAIARFGRIDTWVNNAGIGLYGRLDEISEADSRRMFDINFWGIVNGSLVALPYLKKNGGALINIGSVASEAVTPKMGMYSASKHAVKGYTDALRVEIQQVDDAPVSITLVEPPAVDTPFAEHQTNATDKETVMPEGSLDPQEIADAILNAAVKPTRYARVSMTAKVDTFVSRNLPGISDRMAPKHGKDFEKDEPPQDPAGTLYKPGQSGRTHGQRTGAGS